jgi:hypothetical protein
MLNGIYLTLKVGPAVPVTVPQIVTDALTSIKVIANTDTASAFELTFTLSNQSPLHTIFLLAAGNTPLLRVMLIVTISGSSLVLMDGVTTMMQVTPGTDTGQAILTVTGEDMTRVMDSDTIDLSGLPYPAMAPEARVALIIAKYAVLGLVPLVVPSLYPDVSSPTNSIPSHRGSDLEYVRQLAADVGYVFYIDPGPAVGTSTAYWGPEIKTGVAQPALNLNMDAFTNVESIDFNFQTGEKVLPIVYIQNALTKAPIPIPIPDVNPLQPALGATGLLPTRVEVLRDTAKASAMQAIGRGLAVASSSADGVTASGSVDVLRYGRLLKARQLVGVRGAGTAFDGLYFVKSVTSTMKRGEFKQSFELTRNGLVSITSTVPV